MNTISFDNTEIAFRSNDKADLNRAYWLFKIISINFLVKLGQPFVRAAIALQLPIKGIIKATVFGHFCGGENITDCERTLAELSKFNIGTILDYSVEGHESEKDFDAAVKETLATIHRAKGDSRIPFSVFKVTGMARFAMLEKISAMESLTSQEEIEFQKIKERVNTICKLAYESNVPVFIDAEETWIQQAIDDLANNMMTLYNKQKAIVYNTFQFYRKDRLQYLKDSFAATEKGNYFLGAKLVRGAYMEKERKRAMEMNYPSPIQSTKNDTDKDYDDALEFCIEHIDRIAICAGTHNEKSSLHLAQLMQNKNIFPSHTGIYFSQLLGMSDHISYNLANAGYNVAKYVPYGPVEAVLPYLFRRAEENTSIAGQMGRELSLILKERRRRQFE